MAGYTDYFARKLIDLSTGKTGVTTPTVYMALFTAVGTDAGTGFTEVTGGSYARVATAAADWNAAGASDPSTTTNANAINFPTASASWGTVVAIGAYDAATGGNLLWWDYLGNFDWKPFTATLASPSVLTAPAHGYANGDSVVLTSEYGGTLPTGGTFTGTLTVAGAATDTFNVGVNATASGSGMVRKVATQSVPSGVAASFAAGSLTMSLT